MNTESNYELKECDITSIIDSLDEIDRIIQQEELIKEDLDKEDLDIEKIKQLIAAAEIEEYYKKSCK